MARLIFCSGQIYYDLLAGREEQKADNVAIVRVEQLYPLLQGQVNDVLLRYPLMAEVVWAQEEPRNMGAWSFVAPRLQELLAGSLPLRYVGRSERSSPAEGMTDAHAREQTRIVNTAFAGERQARIETYGGMNGD